MGNCLSTIFQSIFQSSESMSPPHHGSTPVDSPVPTSGDPSMPISGDPALPPPMEATLATSGDSVPLPMDSTLPASGDPKTPPPSLPTSPLNPSMVISGDPMAAPLMDPSLPTSGDFMRPAHDMNVIKSIEDMYKEIDLELIYPLFSFIETQLQKMNTPSEAGTSSSEGWLAAVGDVTKLAAATIDIISKEAEKINQLYTLTEMGSVTFKVMKGLGEWYRVFVGLSVAAFAAESYTSVGSNRNECKELLLEILELAKNVKQHGQQLQQISRENVCSAVCTIVKGAVICLGYLKGGEFLRFWSADTAAAQLGETNERLAHVTQSLHEYSRQVHDFQWRKEVFLSHRGIQKNFVEQLHRDLTAKGVSCFFDKESLLLAEPFPPHIFKAAETCKIAVLIISEEFINSKWPMLELAAFFSARNSGRNANLKILPIFFNVTPNELAHITKDIKWQKFVKLSDTTGDWKAALTEVRSINGLSFGKGESEMDFRDKVVKKISDLLKEINPPKLLDFEPVDIEDQVREVEALLDMKGSQSALAVLVCGFGGVGKTTIASSVVQSLDWSSKDFKFCWVVIDEKNPDKTSHIMKLQEDIINVLEGVKPDFRNPVQGRVRIKEALRNNSALLFIDNVVAKDYIQELLPKDFSCEKKKKLRLLITAREKSVEAELMSIECKVHEVRPLSKSASQLLLKTIVQDKVAEDKDFDEISMINEVAEACRGVPLLLSVFGKHLRVARDAESYKKDKDSYLKKIYEEALDVLREGNLDTYRDGEHLSKTLMFVYKQIEDVEVQEAFLDICTFFHGWEWNLVADIVDFPKLENLKRRMLVSRSGSGEVIVHDILRLLGMNVANLSRISDYKKLSDALKGDLEDFEVGKVKGISLVRDNPLIKFQSTQLEPMRHSLRVLMLGDWVTLEGLPSEMAFTKLRYLRVGDITAFPFQDPSKLNNLKVFLNRSKPGMNLSNLPSSLKRITHEVPDVECDKFGVLPFKNLSSLESFIVKTKTPVDLPKELHLPQSLVDLELNRCMNLPKDIGHLTALESLILDRSDLQCLSHGFGNLKKLKRLSMGYCSKLGSLSEDFGMLSSLEALSMKNCRNLRALPKSFGGLLSLQKLELDECINMKVLPESFGELRLQSLNLHSLDNLNELTNSFGNMPLLKYLSIQDCLSLKSLPKSFVQLKMLETLEINFCTKLSVLPEGFGQFEKLRFLNLSYLFRLKTLSDDFENMATLERLEITDCPELDGAMMEKILKLQNCYEADISRSTKLLEKWEHMKGKSEHPIMVRRDYKIGTEEVERAMRVALFRGKCVEVNDSSGQLMERSSLLEGLEEGITATVALIMIPIRMQSHHLEELQLFVKIARKRAESNGSGKLQIVCAGKVELKAERGTAREKEESAEEEDGIRQILVSLPKGSCTIPSSQSKRLKILTLCCNDSEYSFYQDKLSFFMANVGLDNQRRNCFENSKFTREYEISANVSSRSVGRWIGKRFSGIQSFESFIQSLLYGQTQCQYVADSDGQSECQYVAGKSKTEEFVELLKGNGIDHLLTHNNNNTSKMVVDDLNGKRIGFIICDFQFVKYMLQQVCKDLQKKDSNFIAIWIPSKWREDCGLGSCTRLIECMPLLTFLYPQLVSFYRRFDGFVVLDKDGKIVNDDELLLMGLGVKNSFTQHTIPEPQSFSTMGCKSFLEFLLHGMNIVGRSKMTFLYVDDPAKWHKRKSKLEESCKIFCSYEVLYVGHPSYYMRYNEWHSLEILKQEYEDATQDICCPSLSFSEMMMFWYRCWYMEKSKTWFMGKLWECDTSLLLVDNNGIVTSFGYDVLQMTCEWDVSEGEGMRMVKNELMKSLSRGECTPILKTFLGDKIHKHPRHSQHPIECCTSVCTCDVCDADVRADTDGSADGWSGRRWDCDAQSWSGWDSDDRWSCGWDTDDRWWSGRRSYRCGECRWYMCGSCWRANAKQQIEQILRAKEEKLQNGNGKKRKRIKRKQLWVPTTKESPPTSGQN